MRKYSNKNQIFLDLENKESINKIIDLIPLLDSVIFCPGILLGKGLEEYDDPEILNVFQINVLGPIEILLKIKEKLNNKCSIVFIGSIAGSAGSFDEVYASSKSALNGLIKSLAKKSKNAIRYNIIAPGLIANSSMIKNFTQNEIENHKLQTPTNELNDLKKLSKVCFQICQAEWSQLNGQIIDINGGRYV